MSEKGLRVLVIDDEPQIRKLLKVSLGAHGYDVHEAVTGTDAVTQAAVIKPDLVILDLGLPDLDGKTFHLWARSHTGGTGYAAVAKVVAVTTVAAKAATAGALK